MINVLPAPQVFAMTVLGISIGFIFESRNFAAVLDFNALKKKNIVLIYISINKASLYFSYI